MGDDYKGLVASIQAGTKAEKDRAFTELERLLRPSLMKVCESLARGRYYDADDFYQFALLTVQELAEQWEEGRAKKPFEGAVVDFCRLRLKDYLRALRGSRNKLPQHRRAEREPISIQQIEAAAGNERATLSIEAPDSNPLEILLRREGFEQLLKRIQGLSDRLTPRQIEILTLYAKGYSIQETADILGLSRATVDHWNSRMRDTLGLRKTSGGENLDK